VLLPRDRARLTSSIERRRISPLPASPASPTGCSRPGLWDADGLSRGWGRGRVSGVGLSSAQSRRTSDAVSRWSVFHLRGRVLAFAREGDGTAGFRATYTAVIRRRSGKCRTRRHWKALQGTGRHSRALPGRADGPENFFSGPPGGWPGSSTLLRPVQRADRQGPVPAHRATGLLRTAVDTTESLRTIPHYQPPLHITIQPPRLQQTIRPKPTPIPPSNPVYLTPKPETA
jgi:hypothetical protein